MSEFGLGGGLVATLIALFLLWMGSRVLAKAGFSPWWVLLVLVPLINIIALWVFAFGQWPKDRQSSESAAPPPAPEG